MIREAVGEGSQFGVGHLHRAGGGSGSRPRRHDRRDFLGDDPFLMYLGDNLIKYGLVPFVEHFRDKRSRSLILLTQVPDPENFGVAELDGDSVVRLVEKPKEPAADLALVGVYMFTPRSSRPRARSSPRAAASWRSPTRSSSSSTRPRVEPHSSAAGGRTPAGSKTCSRRTA